MYIYIYVYIHYSQLKHLQYSQYINTKPSHNIFHNNDEIMYYLCVDMYTPIYIYIYT